MGTEVMNKESIISHETYHWKLEMERDILRYLKL